MIHLFSSIIKICVRHCTTMCGELMPTKLTLPFAHQPSPARFTIKDFNYAQHHDRWKTSESFQRIIWHCGCYEDAQEKDLLRIYTTKMVMGPMLSKRNRHIPRPCHNMCALIWLSTSVRRRKKLWTYRGGLGEFVSRSGRLVFLSGFNSISDRLYVQTTKSGDLYGNLVFWQSDHFVFQ